MNVIITGFFLGLAASLPIHVAIFYWLHAQWRKNTFMAVEAAKERAVDNWLTSQERQLYDARRSYMPRADAGPPAIQRTGIHYGRSLKA